MSFPGTILLEYDVSQDDCQNQIVLSVRMEALEETSVSRSQMNVQRLVVLPPSIHGMRGPLTTRIAVQNRREEGGT